MSAVIDGGELSPAVQRAKAALHSLSLEFAQKPGEYRYGGTLQDREWYEYEPTFRLCAVMLSGLEGDTALMCSQRWQRFTPPEQHALSSALRSLRRDAQKVRACAL